MSACLSYNFDTYGVLQGSSLSLIVSLIYSFIPKCRPDGSYDSAQCHLGANFCWCVTPEGVPLPYTSSRRKNDNRPPKCGRKKTNRRRSSPASRRQQRNKICKRNEKSLLNNNLINSFQTEFIR